MPYEAVVSESGAVALRFSHGYANPEDFQHWLMGPAKAEAYLAEVAPDPDPTPA